MPYAFQFQDSVFTPDGRADMSADQIAEYNAAVESAELTEWRKAPARFLAYVDRGNVTTWRGVVLGSIVYRSRYRSNMYATRMECVTVRGNNGATYHGRYAYDNQQCVMLRKSRG